MSENTSSPEVIPQMTKTDAKELKALVRNDTKVLDNELQRRRDKIDKQLAKIAEERKAEDEATLRKEINGLMRRVKNLNEAIVEKLSELADEGWTVDRRNYRYMYSNGTGEIDPHTFTVEANFSGLLPPDRDNSDLQEAYETLNEEYYNASSSLQSREAEMLRELTLRSVTTEAAQEFIMDLPTPEKLLPAPTIVQQLEG